MCGRRGSHQHQSNGIHTIHFPSAVAPAVLPHPAEKILIDPHGCGGCCFGGLWPSLDGLRILFSGRHPRRRRPSGYGVIRLGYFSRKNAGPPKAVAVVARLRHQEIQKVKKEKGKIPSADDDDDDDDSDDDTL